MTMNYTELQVTINLSFIRFVGHERHLTMARIIDQYRANSMVRV